MMWTALAKRLFAVITEPYQLQLRPSRIAPQGAVLGIAGTAVDVGAQEHFHMIAHRVGNERAREMIPTHHVHDGENLRLQCIVEPQLADAGRHSRTGLGLLSVDNRIESCSILRVRIGPIASSGNANGNRGARLALKALLLRTSRW